MTMDDRTAAMSMTRIGIGMPKTMARPKSVKFDDVFVTGAPFVITNTIPRMSARLPRVITIGEIGTFQQRIPLQRPTPPEMQTARMKPSQTGIEVENMAARTAANARFDPIERSM